MRLRDQPDATAVANSTIVFVNAKATCKWVDQCIATCASGFQSTRNV